MPSLLEMENAKEKLTDELKDINKAKKQHKYIYSAGYSPKCSVCNHKKIIEIEELRANGYTLEEIKEELGLEVSIMALSRHFKNHTPKRTEYKIKQALLVTDKVISLFKDYPFLETYFKTRDLLEIEDFLNNNGFCTDCFKICSKIKGGVIGNSKDVIEYHNNEIEEIINENYSISRYEMRNIFKHIQLKDDCINCKDKVLHNRLNILEAVVSKNIIDLDVTPKELIYLLYTKYDNDLNYMLLDLGITRPGHTEDITPEPAK